MEGASEAASAHISNPEIIRQMRDLRELCATYTDRKVFDILEAHTESPLATEARSRGKTSKDRVMLAYN